MRTRRAANRIRSGIDGKTMLDTWLIRGDSSAVEPRTLTGSVGRAFSSHSPRSQTGGRVALLVGSASHWGTPVCSICGLASGSLVTQRWSGPAGLLPVPGADADRLPPGFSGKWCNWQHGGFSLMDCCTHTDVFRRYGSESRLLRSRAAPACRRGRLPGRCRQALIPSNSAATFPPWCFSGRRRPAAAPVFET